MTTHENFLPTSKAAAASRNPRLNSELRTLVSVPLFHVTGCNSQFLVACGFGGTTVIMPAFEVQTFLRASARADQCADSVPAVYWLAMNQPNFAQIDTSSVARVSYGGAPIAPDLVLRIMEAFPNARVGNGFGLTETPQSPRSCRTSTLDSGRRLSDSRHRSST